MSNLKGVFRIFVVVVVAFYVIAGGLYLVHYLPWHRAMAYVTTHSTNTPGWGDDIYNNAALRQDIMNMDYHEAAMANLQSILIWGTILLIIVGAGGAWATRGFERKEHK